MRTVIVCIILCSLSACVNTKIWEQNQYLLAPPIVKGNKILPAEDFMYMHRQKTNGKWLFFSKVALYQRGERRYNKQKIENKIEAITKKWDNKRQAAEKRNDSIAEKRLIAKKEKKLKKPTKVLKEGNWLMRVVGEKPVFFDSMATVRTAVEMTKLLYSKGFFQGFVNFKVDTLKGKRKRAVYEIVENLPTYLDTVLYITNAPKIDSLLQRHASEKLLKKGDYYNTSKIDAERNRIEQLLLNNGYMFFSRQYISFDVDTTHFKTFANFDHTNYTEQQQDSIRKLKRNAKISVIIADPPEGTHEVFAIDAVYMHQILPKNKHLEPDTVSSSLTQIKYIYVGKTLRNEYHILDRRIRLRPSQLYNTQKILDTQNSLYLLDMYKFVNVKTDTIGGKLHVHLFSNPLDRYQLTFEGGSNVAQGLPGPFVNLSLKNRNIFGGAEFLETSLRFLIDGQSSTTGQGAYTSRELGGSLSLTFPRILFPSSLLVKSLRENIYSYNPTTKLSIGYGFTRRPEYTRSNLVGSISYKGQLKRATYNFTLVELSLINTTRIAPEFGSQLDSLARLGNPIRFSFGNALVGSTYFTYTYTNTTDIKAQKSYYFRILLEIGGNSMRLLDRAFDKKNNDSILGVPYFQFFRINPTFHYYIPLPKKRFLAFRLNAGIAVPYGKSTVLPYEKYFFAGGSSSVRAWLPRLLGQGALALEYDDKGRPKYRRTVEKPGEVILEGNAEYRFPLYQGWIEGAAFLDIGNVWKLKEDITTINGGFDIRRFYQQLAIGVGGGIRMDFSFLLLRFDVGLKVHEPRQIPSKRWVIWAFAPNQYLNQRMLNFNVAIGYPF